MDEYQNENPQEDNQVEQSEERLTEGETMSDREVEAPEPLESPAEGEAT